MTGDLRARQALVGELWRLQGAAAGRTVGGVAWADVVEPASGRTWRDGDRPVAWLGADGEAILHPHRPELAAEVVAAAGGGDLWLASGQEALRAEAGARGYAPDLDGPWFVVMTLALAALPPAEPPPAGFRARAVALPGDVAARVRLHRAAWPGSALTDERFGRLTSTWPYAPALDRVVEGPDGSLVASALAWLDEANRVGELEPVGVDPAFGRRGLGRAVSADALAALAHAGARLAVVLARGDDAHPVPRRLYGLLGFRPVADVWRFRR